MIKFGIFMNKQYPAGESARTRFQEHLEQVRLARELGFDTIILGQHFLSAPFQEPQSMPLLARFAAESGNMRLGLSILLGALLHPVEVAEIGATLDLITDGRFICGLGLGYRQEEYDAFGVPKGERVKRFEECVTLVRRLWTEETVTYESERVKLNNVGLGLRTIQQPNPPIWIAADADAAVKRAARMGDTWAINPHASLPAIKRQVALYQTERRTLGLPLPADVPMRRDLYLAPQNDVAWTECRPFMDAKYNAYRAWGQDAVLPADDHWSTEFQELAQDRFLIGDSAAVTDELQRYRGELPDVNHYIFRIQYPGMPQELILRNIRMLAEQVRPHIT